MRRPPPIRHEIHRATSQRHLLGPLYSGSCICGTTWPPTRDRDAREAAIRRHMDAVKRVEIQEAKNAAKRPIRAAQKRQERARKGGGHE